MTGIVCSEPDSKYVQASGVIVGDLTLNFQEGSGTIEDTYDFDQIEKEERERMRDEMSDGGVFFGNKEETDEDGKVVYRNPDPTYRTTGDHFNGISGLLFPGNVPYSSRSRRCCCSG